MSIASQEPGVASPYAPETTLIAAAAVNVSGQLARVYSAIARRKNDGGTGPEIADEVDLSVSLVSTRLKTLYLKELIDKAYDAEDRVVRRYGPSGLPATVWVAPAALTDDEEER
jgi:DNA-binding MarR family transcriptional regulator